MALVRRFAGTAVLAELVEQRLVRGEAVNIPEYAVLSSTLVRLASRIGLERVPKDITALSLDQYIAHRKAEAEADRETDDGVDPDDDDECVGVSPSTTQRHNGHREADE
jgi:hypothetical protein